MAREKVNQFKENASRYPEQMVKKLEALRVAAKLTQEELADYVGFSRARYAHVIAGTAKLSWKNYLAFLFFFEHNERTTEMLHQLELYPGEYIKQINTPTRKELRQNE